MRTFIQKVGKRIKSTVHAFRNDCRISVYLALLRVADELGGRLKLKKLSTAAHARKDQWILNYLKKKLQPILDEYKNVSATGGYQKDAPIWVCWWTGEQKAPALVQQCICSIRRNAGTHPVHIIDRKSCADYIFIPEHMLQKQKSGQITLAQLSDYIRVSLLSEYGGLWLDSTIFCSQAIPESYFEDPLFTCKSEEQECGYISKMQWTSFVLGGWRGQPLFRFMRKAFEEYWRTEKVLIDYLLVDYLIALAKQEIPYVDQCLEAVPINNPHRDDLQAAMNAALPAEQFEDVLCEDTVLYKLSWRESYSMTTAEGRKSVYARFFVGND